VVLATLAAGTLAAARRSHLAHLNRVSDANAASAELGLARAALAEAAKAWALSGASEEGLFAKGFAALNTAQAAIDDIQATLKAVLAVTDPYSYEWVEADLNAHDLACDRTHTAMAEAQAVLNALPHEYAKWFNAQPVWTRAFMHNEQHFQASIIAATEALKKAMSKEPWRR